MSGEKSAGMPRGARILVLSQLTKAGVQFLGLAVLSRLILPEDFGVIAIAVAIVGVGEVIRDMGLSAAAITQPDLRDEQRNVLFWVNALIGVGLAALLCALTPLISAMFGQPMLLATLPALSLVFVFNGFGAQYRAELNRRMRFIALALADSAAPLAGVGAGIVLAVLGAGAWALVAQQLVISVVATVVLVAALRWVPGLPRDWKGTKDLLLFGVRVSWSQILTYLGNHVDTFALGLWGTAAALGNYNRAFQSTIQPLTLLKSPATSVALPMLSRRREDPVGFSRAAARGQQLVAYTIIPMAAFIAGTAIPLVVVVLGDRWSGIAGIVTVLAAAGAVQQLVSVASWIFLAGNHGKALSRYSALSLVVKSVLVIIAAPWGPLAVAFAFLVAMLLMAPVALIWATRTAGLRLRVFLDVWRPLLVAAVASGLAYLVISVMQSAPIVEVLAGLGVFAAVYAAVLVVPAFRRDIRDVMGLLLRRS